MPRDAIQTRQLIDDTALRLFVAYSYENPGCNKFQARVGPAPLPELSPWCLSGEWRVYSQKMIKNTRSKNETLTNSFPPDRLNMGLPS
jgi:hypothetical protein